MVVVTGTGRVWVRLTVVRGALLAPAGMDSTRVAAGIPFSIQVRRSEVLESGSRVTLGPLNPDVLLCKPFSGKRMSRVDAWSCRFDGPRYP